MLNGVPSNKDEPHMCSKGWLMPVRLPCLELEAGLRVLTKGGKRHLQPQGGASAQKQQTGHGHRPLNRVLEQD